MGVASGGLSSDLNTEDYGQSGPWQLQCLTGKVGEGNKNFLYLMESS